MINMIKLSSDEDIEQLEENFKDAKEEINKVQINEGINKVQKYPIPRPITRNYCPRPTPPNLQYEEIILNNAKYNGTAINKWNIDGM